MIEREITAQNYELIRNQIGAILALELDRQATYYYVTEVEGVTVYIERFATIDKTDLAYVNVSMDAVAYSNEHTGNSDGRYIFFVDVFVNSKASNSANGDKLAGYKMQRLMGICRSIIKDPQYKALGLNSPGAAYIMRSTITNMEALTMKDHSDALSTRVGRITMEVRANEGIPFPEGNLLTDHVTQLKLNISDKGLRYVYGADAPSPVDNRYVKILDQYRNVLALLEGGDEYTVTRIMRIIDTVLSNQITVTDNIIP